MAFENAVIEITFGGKVVVYGTGATAMPVPDSAGKIPVSIDDLGGYEFIEESIIVKSTPQTLTDEEKKIATKNISAVYHDHSEVFDINMLNGFTLPEGVHSYDGNLYLIVNQFCAEGSYWAENGVPIGAIVSQVQTKISSSNIAHRRISISIPDFPSDPATTPWNYIRQNSPEFTGSPEVPTPNSDDNSKRIANTEFVKEITDMIFQTLGSGLTILNQNKAAIFSPTFSGTPSGPTASRLTKNNQLANTAFVQEVVSRKLFAQTGLCNFHLQNDGIFEFDGNILHVRNMHYVDENNVVYSMPTEQYVSIAEGEHIIAEIKTSDHSLTLYNIGVWNFWGNMDFIVNYTDALGEMDFLFIYKTSGELCSPWPWVESRLRYNKIEKSAVSKLPKHSLTIGAMDAEFDGMWLKVPFTETLENKSISDLRVTIETGYGTVFPEAIASVPDTQLPSQAIYQGFYVRDTGGLISPFTDVRKYILEFNINDRQDGLINLTSKTALSGDNVIIACLPSDQTHTDWCKAVFTQTYAFQGQIVESDSDSPFQEFADEVDGTTILDARGKSAANYAKSKRANMVFVPYAEKFRNYKGVDPDVLYVVAHRDNSGQRFDLGLEENKFYDGVVLVGAGMSETDNTGWPTSYGNGVEFYELCGTQSEATSRVAAKLKNIKDVTRANWALVRKAARLTASKNNSYDEYRGFGVINVTAAVTYLNSMLGNSNNEMVDRLTSQFPGIERLNFEDLQQNSFVPKRLMNVLMAPNGDQYILFVDNNGVLQTSLI